MEIFILSDGTFVTIKEVKMVRTGRDPDLPYCMKNKNYLQFITVADEQVPVIAGMNILPEKR